MSTFTPASIVSATLPAFAIEEKNRRANTSRKQRAEESASVRESAKIARNQSEARAIVGYTPEYSLYSQLVALPYVASNPDVIGTLPDWMQETFRDWINHIGESSPIQFATLAIQSAKLGTIPDNWYSSGADVVASMVDAGERVAHNTQYAQLVDMVNSAVYYEVARGRSIYGKGFNATTGERYRESGRGKNRRFAREAKQERSYGIEHGRKSIGSFDTHFDATDLSQSVWASIAEWFNSDEGKQLGGNIQEKQIIVFARKAFRSYCKQLGIEKSKKREEWEKMHRDVRSPFTPPNMVTDRAIVETIHGETLDIGEFIARYTRPELHDAIRFYVDHIDDRLPYKGPNPLAFTGPEQWYAAWQYRKHMLRQTRRYPVAVVADMFNVHRQQFARELNKLQRFIAA